MTDLVAKIWLCLIVSALLGVIAGWLIWGRPTQRIIAEYRWRLAKVRRNWEAVEDQLAGRRAAPRESLPFRRDRDGVGIG